MRIGCSRPTSPSRLRRQNPRERLAARWIGKLPEVERFRKLPAGGKHALYVTSDAEVQPGAVLRRKPRKSLDFEWVTGSTTCYASHKYTKRSGGNQDSQFQEMRDLLKSFQSCENRQIALFVIVDGPYFTERKMKELEAFTRQTPPRSWAIPIGDLPPLLRQLREE